MNGLNDVTLMGTVGADAEVRQLENDRAVANFSIAINESYTNKAGDKVENTEWVKVEAWNGLANFLGNYGKKGTGFTVKGRLKTDSYTKTIGNEEVTFYSTKVVADKILFTGVKPKANTAAPAQQPAQNNAPAQQPAQQPAQGAQATAQAQTQDYVTNENFANTPGGGDDLPF